MRIDKAAEVLEMAIAELRSVREASRSTVRQRRTYEPYEGFQVREGGDQESASARPENQTVRTKGFFLGKEPYEGFSA